MESIHSFVVIIAVGIIVAVSMFTFSSVVAANGDNDLFKSWKSLIGPLVDLQIRVSQLEAEVESQETRIQQLEEKIGNGTPDRDIEIQIDEFEYDVGDEVAITGAIDEDVLEPGVDSVFIEIMFPGGGVGEEIDLDHNAEFDFDYEIAGTAIDGLYTVRVEYGSTRAFSYFIVDEDDNLVDIEVEDDAFRAGQNVELVGFVEDPIAAVDEVEITVFDPDNDKIFNQEDVSLDENDEFGFDFDLSADAPLGRYAIIVSYDGVVGGEALFEVHE